MTSAAREMISSGLWSSVKDKIEIILLTIGDKED